MQAKFGPLEKKKKGYKTIDMNPDAIFQNNSRVNPFWRQEEWRNFGRDEK